MDSSWMDMAECRRMMRTGELDVANRDRVLYPTRHARAEDVAEGRAICRRCFVREQCLDHAMATNEDQGIWGGTTESDRRKLRRQMRKKTKEAVSA